MTSILNTAQTTFESMFDLNFGLIKVIQKHFKHANCFDQNLLELSDDDLAYELMTNKNENPIKWIFKKDYSEDSADDLRDTIKEKYYDEVLKFSKPTCIYNIFDAFENIGGGNLITGYVACKNEKQLQFIKNKIPTIKAFVKEYIDVNRETYGSLYINNIKLIKEFDKVIGKNIFILNYRYNFEEDGSGLLKDYYSIYKELNEIKIMDSFNDLDISLG